MIKKIITFVLLTFILTACNNSSKFDKENDKEFQNNNDIIPEVLLDNPSVQNIFCEEFRNQKIMYFNFNFNFVVLEDGNVYRIASPGKKFSNGSSCEKEEIGTIIKKRLSHDGRRFLDKDDNIYSVEYNDTDDRFEIKQIKSKNHLEHNFIDLFENHGVDEILSSSLNDSLNPTKIFIVVLKNNSIYKYIYSYEYVSATTKYSKNELLYSSDDYEGDIIYYFSGRYDEKLTFENEYLITDKAFYKTEKITDDCDRYEDIECEYVLKKQGSISMDNYRYISNEHIIDSEYNWYFFPY